MLKKIIFIAILATPAMAFAQQPVPAPAAPLPSGIVWTHPEGTAEPQIPPPCAWNPQQVLELQAKVANLQQQLDAANELLRQKSITPGTGLNK